MSEVFKLCLTLTVTDILEFNIKVKAKASNIQEPNNQ